MNTIYIIFISIIAISFILGLFVTFFKAKYNMKLHKYNNYALQEDNYKYAKDYVYQTNVYNFSDKIKDIEEKTFYEKPVLIPIESDNVEENAYIDALEPIIYAILDDDVIC